MASEKGDGGRVVAALAIQASEMSLGDASVILLGADGNDGVKSYYNRVLRSMLETSIDDGLLAAYLNEQIEAWEQDGEAIGDPLWPQYVDLLHIVLASLRARIAGRMR
jgi:hypothetical protein